MFGALQILTGLVYRLPMPVQPLKALAAIVFDGMQSQRWAAPPTMSFSIRVTRPPFIAAVVAAWVPAGPPPMISR